MPRQQRDRSNTGYYHIMIRGNDKKDIFIDEQDKIYFIEILKTKKEENKYGLIAFCIMDNHAHLILQEKEEDIANIMKRINISYVFYFNKKYKRIGHLFQDRYKSEKIEEDSYLLMATRYIHQNPVKAGIVNKAEQYKWSSYKAYIGKDEESAKEIDKELVLGILAENETEAIKELEKFTNMDGNDIFIDIDVKSNRMEEKQANKLWDELNEKENPLEEKLKTFRAETNLPLRKLAEITGINKDKINILTK
ncbi:REP-associated tyrosine transposase [Anaerosinus sp.]|uniref:REP-associated tyrosine transposase n=1 Tax=Selenobaculum sp. TaxID=3074374 RepID=UPI003AB7216E